MEKNKSYPIQIKLGIKSALCASIFSIGWIVLLFIFSFFYFAFSEALKVRVSNQGILTAFINAVLPKFIILMIVLTLLGILISWLSMKFTGYTLDNKTFIFKNGIIARSEKNLPYSKIQHIVLYESFWQRIFGISSVSIETASESIFNLQGQNQGQQQISTAPFIPNLLKSDAIKLRQTILLKTLKTRGSGI